MNEEINSFFKASGVSHVKSDFELLDSNCTHGVHFMFTIRLDRLNYSWWLKWISFYSCSGSSCWNQIETGQLRNELNINFVCWTRNDLLICNSSTTEVEKWERKNTCNSLWLIHSIRFLSKYVINSAQMLPPHISLYIIVERAKFASFPWAYELKSKNEFIWENPIFMGSMLRRHCDSTPPKP